MITQRDILAETLGQAEQELARERKYHDQTCERIAAAEASLAALRHQAEHELAFIVAAETAAGRYRDWLAEWDACHKDQPPEPPADPTDDQPCVSACPDCGSTHVTGRQVTETITYTQHRCHDCGSLFDWAPVPPAGG